MTKKDTVAKVASMVLGLPWVSGVSPSAIVVATPFAWPMTAVVGLRAWGYGELSAPVVTVPPPVTDAPSEERTTITRGVTIYYGEVQRKLMLVQNPLGEWHFPGREVMRDETGRIAVARAVYEQTGYNWDERDFR